MSEELERMRAELDVARDDVERLRASSEFAYNESYLRMEEILQMRLGIHRAERERDEARAETARLRAQLDPESVKHWDSMRAERDAARAALRDLNLCVEERVDHDGNRFSFATFSGLVRKTLIEPATAAALRAAKEEKT